MSANIYCSKPIANIYKESDNTHIAFQVMLGQLVVKKGETEKFYNVNVFGLNGWIDKEDVDSKAYDNSLYNTVITTMNVVAYAAPDIYSNHLPTLYCGTKIRPIEIKDNWLFFEAYSLKGWMYTWNVEKIVTCARSFIGTRVLSGGNSYQGMDNLGLVHLYLKTHGIDVERSYKAILEQGLVVQARALKEGDIIFLDSEHAGVCDKSDGITFIIHTSEDRVVKQPLISLNRFVTARRFI